MSAAAAPSYPRPISAGGYAFPPMVEDRLPIVSAGNCIRADGDTKQRHLEDDGETYRTDVLLVRPTDMETLWEWLAYTKSRTDADPSWGRVWPTALSLSRLVLRSVCGGCPPEPPAADGGGSGGIFYRSVRSLRASCHAVELGCGLGVAGLTYAASYMDGDQRQQYRGRRTVTFLDREPHALHCAMSSCALNGVATGGMDGAPAGGGGDGGGPPKIVARAAMDDWNLPVSDGEEPDEDRRGPRNVRYRDLQLETAHMSSSFDNADTVVIASDVLYEPEGMPALASKIRGLLHPERGGHALLADPATERTAGCRDAFVEAVAGAGGGVEVVPLPEAGEGRTAAGGGGAGPVLGGDVDIDGTLAKTVLICVEFPEEAKE